MQEYFVAGDLTILTRKSTKNGTHVGEKQSSLSIGFCSHFNIAPAGQHEPVHLKTGQTRGGVVAIGGTGADAPSTDLFTVPFTGKGGSASVTFTPESLICGETKVLLAEV